MDYKRIIKSQRLRFSILKALSFLPDSIMLSLQYRIKTGRKLNLNKPTRYTEKVQLYKMFYRNPDLPICVDKYEVRSYVNRKGFSNILNTLYGVYDVGDDINFEELPDRFVIKTTDGGGGQNVLICRQKEHLDIQKTILTVNSWLNKKDIDPGREWAYTKIKNSRIIIEKYLENLENPDAGIQDYKFFCFSGEPYMICVDSDRFIVHKRNIYDLSWKKLNVVFNDYPLTDLVDEKPENLEEMIYIVKKLSEDFPHVRVDLYNISGQIIFGELTFYPSSGYCHFIPDNFDYILGDQFDISSFYKMEKC